MKVCKQACHHKHGNTTTKHTSKRRAASANPVSPELSYDEMIVENHEAF